MFRRALTARLRARVADDSAPSPGSTSLTTRERLGLSARYTMGDLTMVRKELAIGFVVAGFLTVHVPNSWWTHVFLSGHGGWTVLENVAVAPLVSVLAFVCSVGNVPLAAALWGHGVAFGGVIAFLFADLVTLPLLVIYRRYYGTATAWRLFALLWTTASGAGLVIDGLFRVTHLIPTGHQVKVLSGEFPLGATLVLNVLATIVLAALWQVARGAKRDSHAATDPICGMTVDPSNAPASAVRDGESFYFCSLGCRDKFLARDAVDFEGPSGHIDPICGMSVAGSEMAGVGPDGATYYFCSEGCRETFLHGAAPANHHHE